MCLAREQNLTWLPTGDKFQLNYINKLTVENLVKKIKTKNEDKLRVSY